MTEPKQNENENPEIREERESASPFELAGEEESTSPEAVAKALAEHQMEAIEEAHERGAFDLADDDGAEAEEEGRPEETEPATAEATEEGSEETPAGEAEAVAEETSGEDEEEGGEMSEADADAPLVIDLAEAKKIVETLLFVAHDPLRPRDISYLFRGVANVNSKVIRKFLEELAEDYRERPLQIVEVAEGFRMCTRAEFSPWVRRFLKAERKTKLSQAALETLAIIAYKQPITKAEVEEIRRVDCAGVMNTLLERQLIRVLGRRDVVGRPLVYSTTPLFLEHFGFKSLSDLPKPDEFEAASNLDLGGEGSDAEILPIGDEDLEAAAARQAGGAGAEEPEEANGASEILKIEQGENSEPYTNGRANGHSNGHANGHSNGHGTVPEAAGHGEDEGDEGARSEA